MIKRELGISTCVFDNFQLVDCIELLGKSSIKQLEWSDNFFSQLLDDKDFLKVQRSLTKAQVKIHSIHVPFWLKESNVDSAAFLNTPCPGPVDIAHPDYKIRRAAIKASLLCIKRLKQLKGRFIVMHLSRELEATSDRKAYLQRALDSLLEIKKNIPSDGSVKVALENLPRWCLGNQSSELLWMLEKLSSDNFGICLDVNHCFKETLGTMTEKLGGKIVTLHLSDTDGIDERHWMPGRGILPWGNWHRLIDRIGFQGPLVYEINPDWNGEGILSENPLAVINAVEKNARELFGTKVKS